MSTILQDLRFALRQLRRAPGFSAVAILTLALAVGANTAIFSVMNAVLLRMLPVRDPQQLVYLSHENSPAVPNTGDSRYTYNINVYHRLREDRSVFADVIAYVPLSFNKTAIRLGDTPEEARADEVSGNFFSGLGVPMALGQPFAPADEDRHAPLAVLGYGFWNRRLHHDPGVLGKTIFINGVPFTIVGVAAPSFFGVESDGSAADLWVPLQNRPELNAWGLPATGNTLYGTTNWWALMLMARLEPGLTPERALPQASNTFAHAAYETLGTPPQAGAPKLDLTFTPARGLGLGSSSYRDPLRVLMGMVGLVLVIACVNISMLLAARNATREREFSLRLALGASRWPLLRQLLAESALLVTAGVLLGWIFAIEATRLLAAWSEFETSLSPDAHVFAFTLAVAGAAALLFGLAPLRSAASAPITAVLKSSGAQTGETRGRVLSGKILVALQISFCLALLSGAGLLIRTLRNYQHIDLGMRADSVLAFGVHPSTPEDGPETLGFYHRLTDRLRAVPGVASVTLAANRPGSGWSDNNTPVVDGRAYTWDDGRNDLRTNLVGPNFFQTLGIPVLAGRDLRASDTETAPAVAVVNQTFVDRYLKGQSPLGHTLGDSKHPGTIVGVVADNKYTAADESPLPMAWASYQQASAIQNMDVEVRTSAANPLTLLPAIRRIVREIDPNAPLGDPKVLQTQFAESYLMPALFARLAAFFGLLAALLVAVGLYGTLSYRVSRRTSEIGIRMALGAARGQVMGMILRDSLVLVAAGCALGLPLAWFGSRLMSSMLYQLSAHDPLSLALAVAGVLLVSITAALLPARRAATIDPVEALRTE